MPHFSSTHAKQSFGELLDAAARGPVAIEKHRKVRAILAAPEFFSATSRHETQLADRRAARANQALVEKDRLIKHQRIAIDLVTLPREQSRILIRRAKAVVDQWRRDRLCSQDYIDRWSQLLSLPAAALARAMTSDSDGWGPALRQNSPWSGVAP